jgi:hypothetical protein
MRDNAGNFIGFNPLLGAEPPHTQGIAGEIPYTRNREIFDPNRECFQRQQGTALTAQRMSTNNE